LVSYGANGQILPALAKSWEIMDTSEGGSKYTFQLRENVMFHDGTPWNCEAAKMNFDHVLAGPLREPEWHGWYGVPKYIKDWVCTSDLELVLTTKIKFYPFLQELSFIRPLRFLSPNAFAEGSSSDPFTANSCKLGWGTVEGEDGTTVICAGISNVSGTGPFAFSSRSSTKLTTGDFDETTVDDEVIFTRNAKYWGGAPAFETLKVIRYDSADQIKAALLDGTLDVMWGGEVLSANEVTDIDNLDDPNLNVYYGDDIQNAVLLLNTGRPPLDDINIRKTIIHGINKKRLINKELGGYLDPVDHVFPESMPYCDVDLTPHWDYDKEKADLLSCADESSVMTPSSNNDDKTLALGLGIGLGSLCVLALGFAFYYVKKSRDLEAVLLVSKNGIQT
jgi:nickel transport system substrate-binding protein